jgi:hypothetical protein
MSKLDQIAKLLQTDTKRANLFCLRVQKEFREPPGFSLILPVLKQLPPDKRTMGETVEWIKCHQPGNCITPAQIATIPTAGVITKHKRQLHPGQSPGSYPNMGDEEKDISSPIFRHDPRDHQEYLPKCPHGVPYIQVCAICDPKKFKIMTGID